MGHQIWDCLGIQEDTESDDWRGSGLLEDLVRPWMPERLQHAEAPRSTWASALATGSMAGSLEREVRVHEVPIDTAF